MIMGTSKDIFRLFLTTLAIGTALCSIQFLLHFYPALLSWPRPLSSESTSKRDHKLKESIQWITSAPPFTSANLTNGETPIFKHTTTLATHRACSKYYYLIILVSTAPGHWQRRNLIRKTWAFERDSFSRWTTVFLVAQSRIQAESIALLKEDKVHGDLVRANYYDHYWNQTYEIQMGFEWASKYCNFAFLLKADDDVFVNIPRVISFLRDPTTPKENLYAGRQYRSPWVLRQGKWKVTREEYNSTFYPDFCPGFGFILSGDVVVSFVEAFSLVPHFRLDDVYVGMLANHIGIKITNNEGFEFSETPPRCRPNNGTLVMHGILGDCLVKMFNRTSYVRYV